MVKSGAWFGRDVGNQGSIVRASLVNDVDRNQ